MSNYANLMWLGGVGKTQLAIEYAYRFKEDYDVGCWLRCQPPLRQLRERDRSLQRELLQAAFSQPTSSVSVEPAAERAGVDR